MESQYFEQFDEIRKVKSKDFLKEKKKFDFFNTNEFSEDQAFMNYRMSGSIYEQFICLYEGYAETSLFLLEDCITNDHSSKKDIWIFPIFFNIIHALELFLKATRYLLKKIEDNSIDDKCIVEGKHDILYLSKDVYNKIIKNNEFNKFKDDFKLIHTFVKMIKDIFKIETVNKGEFIAPRYPITENNEPYPYVEQNKYIEGTNFLVDERFTIKMKNLYIWVIKIYQICEDVNNYVQYLAFKK